MKWSPKLPTFVTPVLLVATLLLWSDRVLVQPTPRGIELDQLKAQVRTIFDEYEFSDEPFDPEPIIPEVHMHLMTRAGPGTLFSVYVGHYPDLSSSYDRPHDPRLCYRIVGFDIKQEPTAHMVRDTRKDTDGGEYRIERIVVEKLDQEGRAVAFTTFYWSQFAGQMPDPQTSFPGPLRQSKLRFSEQRADLIWTRVEFMGTDRELDPKLQTRLVELMRAGAQAMGTTTPR